VEILEACSVSRTSDFEVSSGNVFRDLGLPDAEELDIKANLAIELGQLIRRRRLTQTEAAAVLGIDQPRVSALVRGHLERFSMEKLCEWLRAMGCDVDIRIRERKKNKSRGRLIVSVE
jgi:predicted XRE-type DNA-binding protein